MFVKHFAWLFICLCSGCDYSWEEFVQSHLFQSGGGTENVLGLIDIDVYVCVCWNYQQMISVLCNSWASPMG